MGLFDKWNKNKFSIYKSEEKTVLKLIESLGKWFDKTLQQVDENTALANENKNKKVSYDDLHKKYKLTVSGTNPNFEGSWQGLNRPTLSEEGMRATVEQLKDETIPNIETRLAEIASVSVKKYGADSTGINDSTQAFIDAIDYAKSMIVSSNFKVSMLVTIPGGIYKISSKIIIPPYVHLKTLGFVIIQSYVEDDSTFWITHQDGDSTFRSIMSREQYLRSPIINASDGGMLIKSMLNKQAGTIGIEIGSHSDLEDSIGVPLPVSRYSLCDIAIQNFDVAMQMNIYNHYIGTFNNLHLELNNTLVRFGRSISNVANSGENFSFHGGVFAAADVGFDHYADGFDCNFYGCSFDFVKTLFNFRRGYKDVKIWGGHIEGVKTIADATTVTDTASLPQLYINSPTCFCDSLELFKGKMKLICDNVMWQRLRRTNDKLYICDDEVYAKEYHHVFRAHDVALSSRLNKIHNSKFQKADLTSGDAVEPFEDFTITKGGFNNPVITATIPSGSSYDRALKAVSTSNTSWMQIKTEKYHVNPGDVVQIGAMYYFDSLEFRNIEFNFTYYDKSSNIILTTSSYADTAESLPNRWNSAFALPNTAPAGADSVSCTVTVSLLLPGESFYIGEIFLGIS